MKRLTYSLILLMMLILITVLVYNNQQNGTIRSEMSDFAIADTASITRIVLKDESGETVDLKRQDDGFWTVNDAYEARPDAIKTLLHTMHKVSVKAPVSQQSMNTVLKTIIASNTLVEAYEDNQVVKTYYVGGANQTHTGTNMMMKGSSRPFVMHIEGFHGFLTPRYFTNELEWRNREVFGYLTPEIKSIAINYNERPELSFSIEDQGAETYSVKRGATQSPAPFDTLMLKAYLSNYKMIHYESYEETKSQEFIDSVLQSPPLWTITLNTWAGESRSVTGFKKPIKNGEDMEGNAIDFDIERLYIKVDDEIYVAQYAIFDKLSKGVYFFK